MTDPQTPAEQIPFEPGPQVILVAYVPLSRGKAALEAAIESARFRSARLVVLNTTPAESPVDSSFASDEDLESVREHLTATGIEFEIRSTVTEHDPSEEILKVAEEIGATLIVLGLHRRSRASAILLGSNTNRVIARATCNVLAVKASEDWDHSRRFGIFGSRER